MLSCGLFLAKATVATERGVELVLSDESLLEDARGHGKALLTVIGNLIDNAVDAVLAGPAPPRVVLDVRQDDDNIHITVSDTGSGIPADVMDDIFRDGFSTKPPRRGVRRGLGLALVRRLVLHLGGEIHVANAETEGAIFRVVLPAPGSFTIGLNLETTGAPQ